jgi:hypothetical protein
MTEPETAPLVAVVTRNGQFAVVARVAIAKGTQVLAIEGPLVDHPTRYTIQVGVDMHVDAEADPKTGRAHPIWRFLNHACAPNTRIEGRSLVAGKRIRAGEEITFDYETTEWDMAAPFPCGCAAATCRGLIRGFRHLTPAQRQRLAGAAPHVLEAMTPAAPATARRSRGSAR